MTQQHMTPLATAYSAEIRATMGAKFITGLTLSKKVGMSQNYIAKRLRDEAPFTLNDLEAVCVALGETYASITRRALARLDA